MLTSELTSEKISKMKKKKKKRKSFVKIEDETGGGDYYQNVETGDTVWDMPEDGES